MRPLGSAGDELRVTFVMEQQVGHQSFYRNLRMAMDHEGRIKPRWLEITYREPESVWERLPGLPARLRGTLVGRAQVIRGLRAVAYDVAFFNTQVPAAISGRTARRYPYVLCTDITPVQYDQMGRFYGHPPDAGGWVARYKHRVNRELFQGAAFTLAWSDWVKASLIGDYGVAPDKVEVLPPGVDLSLWRPGPQRASGRLRVLFVGGDFDRKGGKAILAAFRSLPPGSAELMLVTRTALPPSEGVFAFPDMQPNSRELIALYQSCDVFVLPSHAEAFGIAAVEASAVGLPVVATAVGGLLDIVADGVTGFHIQSGDTETLARHLRRLADDAELRRRLGQAARQRAEARFDARTNTRRIGTLLYQASQPTGTRPRRW